MDADACCALMAIGRHGRTRYRGDLSQAGAHVAVPPSVKVADETVIVVCPTWLDALAIWAETGLHCVASLALENMPHVLTALREAWPAVRLLLCGMRDKSDAFILHNAVRETGATIVGPRYLETYCANGFFFERANASAIRAMVADAGIAVPEVTKPRADTKLMLAKALLLRLLVPSCATQRLQQEAWVEGIGWRTIGRAKIALANEGILIGTEQRQRGWSWVRQDAAHSATDATLAE